MPWTTRLVGPERVLDAVVELLPPADQLRPFMRSVLAGFPWRVEVRDWTGTTWTAGGDTPHWSGEPLVVTLHTEAAGRALLARDVQQFLELYLAGDVDLDGNLYVLSDVRAHAQLGLSWTQAIATWWRNRAFQTPARARVSVTSQVNGLPRCSS